MTEHLPECWAKDPSDPPAWCICDELRACEQRMREEHRHRCSGCDWCYSEGALEALDAARKAVEGLRGWSPPPQMLITAALDAIDALREEQK